MKKRKAAKKKRKLCVPPMAVEQTTRVRVSALEPQPPGDYNGVPYDPQGDEDPIRWDRGP